MDLQPIKEIIETEKFLNRLYELICSTMLERSATVYDSTEGFIEGAVTHFDIDELTVNEVQGEESDWTAKFTGTGTASVGYKTPDGEDLDSDIFGKFEGFIEIGLIADEATPDVAAEKAQLTVTIDYATLKDEPPFDDSVIDEGT